MPLHSVKDTMVFIPKYSSLTCLLYTPKCHNHIGATSNRFDVERKRKGPVWTPVGPWVMKFKGV